MSDKISVIVPAYNVENYITTCLDSLKAQTFRQFEVIVVDDGSKDKTGIICKNYIKKNASYLNIRYLKKENGGLSDARNYGTERSKCKYVFYLDADDYLESNALEILYETAEKSHSVITECGYYWDFDGNKKREHVKNFISIKDYLVSSPVIACNKLYNKEWLSKKRLFFVKGLYYEDVDFLFRTGFNLNSIRQVSVVDIPLYNYVQRKTSITKNVTIRIREIVDIYTNVILYAKTIGKYDTFFQEIEYKAVRNLYCSFYRQLRKLEKKVDRKKCIEAYDAFVEKNFPNWRSNCYLNKCSIVNIYLRIIPKRLLKAFVCIG